MVVEISRQSCRPKTLLEKYTSSASLILKASAEESESRCIGSSTRNVGFEKKMWLLS